MTDRSGDTGGPGGDQLFKQADDMERLYSPQTVPGTHIPDIERDVDGTAGIGTHRVDELPSGGPAAPVGTNSSGLAGVPNVDAYDNQRSAAGDPETQARYPLGDNDRDATG